MTHRCDDRATSTTKRPIRPNRAGVAWTERLPPPSCYRDRLHEAHRRHRWCARRQEIPSYRLDARARSKDGVFCISRPYVPKCHRRSLSACVSSNMSLYSWRCESHACVTSSRVICCFSMRWTRSSKSAMRSRYCVTYALVDTTHMVRHISQALATVQHRRRRLRVLVPNPVETGYRSDRSTGQKSNEGTREWTLPMSRCNVPTAQLRQLADPLVAASHLNTRGTNSPRAALRPGTHAQRAWREKWRPYESARGINLRASGRACATKAWCVSLAYADA